MTQIIHPHGEDAVYDDAEDEAYNSQASVNVGSTERLLSTGAGAILLAAGLSRRSLPGLIAAAIGGGLMYRGISGNCMGYRLLDIDTSDEATAAAPNDYYERGIHVEQSFTIDKSPWDLYAYWRDFTNLPRIMSHLESVTVIDGRRSHWVAKAPAIAGGQVEWDAEIINDEPNVLIAWRSLAGADVDNAGSVRFIPGPESRGTQVKVVIDYIPPAGRLGSWVAKLFGEEPEQQIREDLRRFKSVMETGEAPTTEDQPSGSSVG